MCDATTIPVVSSCQWSCIQDIGPKARSLPILGLLQRTLAVRIELKVSFELGRRRQVRRNDRTIECMEEIEISPAWQAEPFSSMAAVDDQVGIRVIRPIDPSTVVIM